MLANRERKIYIVLIVQMVMLFFLPAMGKAPLAAELGTLDKIYQVIIYAVYALLSIAVVMLFISLRNIENKSYIWWIVAFFVICAIGMIWGVIRGQVLADVIRGFLPFVWYLYIVIAVQLLGEKIDNIVTIVAMLAFAYAVRVIIYYMIYCAGKPDVRVSYFFAKASSFMPILGAVLFTYFFLAEKGKDIVVLGGMSICYLSTILVNARASLLAAVAGISAIVVMVILNLVISKRGIIKEKKKIWKRIMIVILLLCISLLAFSRSSLSQRWNSVLGYLKTEDTQNVGEHTAGDKKDNINLPSDEEGTQNIVKKEGQDENINARIVEYKVAYEYWKESPIIGQGIGFRWTADKIDGGEGKKIDYGGPVIYMHNIVAYILMDFGIVGILYLVICLFILCMVFFKVLKMRNVETEEKLPFFFFASGIGAAFIYANFTAIFRDIEFTFIVTILISGILIQYYNLKQVQISNGDKK